MKLLLMVDMISFEAGSLENQVPTEVSTFHSNGMGSVAITDSVAWWGGERPLSVDTLV